MDSLTQIVLGGSVAYAALGSRIGRKTILYGAVLGTLPDLDVFLPYAGEVEAFTNHRGFSHSILVHALFSPILAWLLAKLHPISSSASFNQSWYRWGLLVFLCLSTHALLDACTVYGTQLMWPITQYPVGTSNLFIIDPLYTLPLFFAFVATLLPFSSIRRKQRLNHIALAVSSLYVMWTFTAKIAIDNKVEQALTLNNIEVGAYMSTPAPFNTLLWRIVVVQPDNEQYYEIYASIFDTPQELSIVRYKSSPELISSINNDLRIERLQWFTKGVYAISEYQNKVVLSDLRMGSECAYVFNFAVGKIEGNTVELGDFEKISQQPDFASASLIWDRIWDPKVELSPTKPCQ